MRKGRMLHIRLYVVWSFFVYNGGHKRGPTSRLIIGTEIQRDCNYEVHVSHFSYRLGCMSSRWFILSSQLSYSLLVHPYRYIILPGNLNRLVHKDFPRSQSSSGSNTRSRSPKSSQLNALNMVRYRKAVYSALWVQLALFVCYLPQFTVQIVIFLSTKRFSNLFTFLGMANVLVFFNSTLNTFLYCWKISEVRRAVKQTIRQAICYA